MLNQDFFFFFEGIDNHSKWKETKWCRVSSQTTNQMHPTCSVANIFCVWCLNPICQLQILSHFLSG